MKRISFIPAGRAVQAILMPAFLLAAAGCGDSEIKTYRIAKEENKPKIPHVHSEDEDPAANAPASMPAPDITYTTPQGWEPLPSDRMRKAVFRISGPDGKMAQVMVIPLPGVSGIELQSVNMWREELGLGALSEADAHQQAQPVALGDAKGEMFDMAASAAKNGTEKLRTLGAIASRDGVMWFAKLTGADELVASEKPAFTNFLASLKFTSAPAVSRSDAPVSANSGTIPPDASLPKWTVPPNWQAKTPGPMTLAAFQVSDGGHADVTISKLEGTAGGIAGNVNRWRNQLQLGPLSESEALGSVQMIEVDGKKDTYLVDLKGTSMRTGRPARMIAVGVPRAGETWFYKLMGDEAAVGSEKDAFLKFILSAY